MPWQPRARALREKGKCGGRSPRQYILFPIFLPSPFRGRGSAAGRLPAATVGACGDPCRRPSPEGDMSRREGWGSPTRALRKKGNAGLSIPAYPFSHLFPSPLGRGVSASPCVLSREGEGSCLGNPRARMVLRRRKCGGRFPRQHILLLIFLPSPFGGGVSASPCVLSREGEGVQYARRRPPLVKMDRSLGSPCSSSLLRLVLSCRRATVCHIIES